MIVEIVPSALHGERVDRIVAFILDVSRSVASGLVERGAVHVDGSVETSGKVRLVEGQEVSVDPSQVPGETLPEADHTVEVSVVMLMSMSSLSTSMQGWSFTRVQEMTRRRLLTAYLRSSLRLPALVNHIDRALCIVLTPAAPVCSSLHEPNMRTTNLFPSLQTTRQHACIRHSCGGIQLRCMV